MNLAMKHKLDKGEAIDVSRCPRTEDGDYILAKFVDGKDYCNMARQEWIWSIGKRKSDGVILAAHDGRFYENPYFDCVWLR